MSNFRDARDDESYKEYLQEVHGGSIQKFYKDFEGDHPINVNAYFRWYNAQQHIALRLPELIAELKRR